MAPNASAILQLTTHQTELALTAKMGGISPGGMHGLLGSVQCCSRESQPHPPQ
jgi:hypothetical protein